jgi:hypothetical protein
MIQKEQWRFMKGMSLQIALFGAASILRPLNAGVILRRRRPRGAAA